MELKRIVVGVDFSEENAVAVREAMRLARDRDVEVVLTHVGSVERDSPWLPNAAARAWAEILAENAKQNRVRLDELRESVLDQGTSVKTLIVDDGPAEGVTAAAKEADADLVVVSTHGRTGLRKFLLGSVAQRVVRICERDVLIVRKDGDADTNGYRKILVPTDFSAHADAALRRALAVAAPGASIELVHFWQLPVVVGGGYGESALLTHAGDHRAAVDVEGEKLVEKYKNENVEVTFQALESGAAHGVVDYAARNGHDAIIIGSHGRRGFRRLLLGSVAEATVRHAPCSVMVVHLRD